MVVILRFDCQTVTIGEENPQIKNSNNATTCRASKRFHLGTSRGLEYIFKGKRSEKHNLGSVIFLLSCFEGVPEYIS